MHFVHENCQRNQDGFFAQGCFASICSYDDRDMGFSVFWKAYKNSWLLLKTEQAFWQQQCIFLKYTYSKQMYMYLLNYFFSIDATFSKRKGRYVNDAARHEELCNAEIRMLYVNYNPVLALFARRFIHAGEEIRYDYGTTDLPWRSKTVFKYI